MNFIELACKEGEKLVIGQCFVTAKVASDREWGVLVDCAACVNFKGMYTKYQHLKRNESDNDVKINNKED